MRVIAGKARRLLLKTIEGQDTRPTTDRIKETLFNMLQYDVPDCRFLDLFSGSGGIAIEALSRGARHAVLVEHNPRAAACIRENLKTTHMEEQGMVMACDVLEAIRRLEQAGEVFDIVFMDPPYELGLEKEVLSRLSNSPLIHEETLLIAEAALDTDFSYAEEMGYAIEKIKEYKTNKHVFLVRGE